MEEIRVLSQPFPGYGVQRRSLLHQDFLGRISTAGNVAFPYSPSDIPMGGVYEFNIFHTIKIEDPVEPFPYKIVEFPRS